jgi:hypothetical protein
MEDSNITAVVRPPSQDFSPQERFQGEFTERIG